MSVDACEIEPNLKKQRWKQMETGEVQFKRWFRATIRAFEFNLGASMTAD